MEKGEIRVYPTPLRDVLHQVDSMTMNFFQKQIFRQLLSILASREKVTFFPKNFPNIFSQDSLFWKKYVLTTHLVPIKIHVPLNLAPLIFAPLIFAHPQISHPFNFLRTLISL